MANISDSLKALGRFTSEDLDNIKSIDVRNYHNADYQYELLCKYIERFQNSLDDEHEVGMQLASFGQSILLNVVSIGYANPSIIEFYGYYNGLKAHLIQNINQLNFLLVAVPKLDPDKPARRIGFDTSSKH